MVYHDTQNVLYHRKLAPEFVLQLKISFVDFVVIIEQCQILDFCLTKLINVEKKPYIGWTVHL